MINTYDFTIARPEYFKQLSVRDLLFLFYKCPQVERNLNLYTHYNEIIFTLSGKKKLNHRNRSWLLTDNTSLFVRKTAYNQEMVYTWEWEVLAFYFQDDFLQQVFKTYKPNLPLKNIPAPPTDMIIEINVSEATRAFFYSIVPYFTQPSPPAESLLELKFKELIFLILSDPANSSLLSYVNNMSERSKAPLHEIMEPNYMFNLSLSEYARIAQRSLASFKREFSEVYRTTPGKWLTQKRLEYAQVLLENSSKNVNEIAYESGFENSTHFNRIFKQKFGLPPLQYRKQKTLSLNGVE